MIEDIDGKDASQALRTSVEMPLRDQIKSAVKGHVPYTRLKHWSGKDSNASLDKIAAKVSPILKMTSPSNPFLTSPLPTPLSPQLDFAGSSISPPSANLQSSKLLLSVQSQESDTSIDVYGTGERVKFSSTRNSLEILNRSDDSLNIPDIQSSFSEESTNVNPITTEMVPLMTMEDTSTSEATRKSIVKTLYKDTILPPLMDSIHQSSTSNNFFSDFNPVDYSSSYDDIADNHSSLLSSIRQRSDTDASIEIYGSNQKVKFDSSSNTIEVSQRMYNSMDEFQSHGFVLGKSEKPFEPSPPWMDNKSKILQSPQSLPNKKTSRRPPNLPRQTSLGKRKDCEKDVENGSFR